MFKRKFTLDLEKIKIIVTKKKYVSCTRKFSNEIATKEREREREQSFFSIIICRTIKRSPRENVIPGRRKLSIHFSTADRRVVNSVTAATIDPRNSSLLATNKNEIPEYRSSVVIWSEHAPRENTSPLKFSIVKCTPVTFVYRSHSIEIPVSLHWRPPRTILATPCFLYTGCFLFKRSRTIVSPFKPNQKM